jgi:purine-nucleoside phosphorylase
VISLEQSKSLVEGFFDVGFQFPKTAIVLGTGLSEYAQNLNSQKKISFRDIGFPMPLNECHGSNLIYGKLDSTPVFVLTGRVHLYEGYSEQEVVHSIRVMKLLGVQNLIITNAAGGLNQIYKPGDISVITDHENMTGKNPLVGKNIDSLGPRFPDMSEPYDMKMVKEICKKFPKVITAKYCQVLGPCLETATEYKRIQTHSSLVGMSTVMEVIAAVHAQMNVTALSVVTDVPNPWSLKKTSIEEIIKAAGDATPVLTEIVNHVVRSYESRAPISSRTTTN